MERQHHTIHKDEQGKLQFLGQWTAVPGKACLKGHIPATCQTRAGKNLHFRAGKIWRNTIIPDFHITRHTLLFYNPIKKPYTPPHRTTVLLGQNETVICRVSRDNPGRWMYHCHIIEKHLKRAVMGLFLKSAKKHRITQLFPCK